MISLPTAIGRGPFGFRLWMTLSVLLGLSGCQGETGVQNGRGEVIDVLKTAVRQRLEGDHAWRGIPVTILEGSWERLEHKDGLRCGINGVYFSMPTGLRLLAMTAWPHDPASVGALREGSMSFKAESNQGSVPLVVSVNSGDMVRPVLIDIARDVEKLVSAMDHSPEMTALVLDLRSASSDEERFLRIVTLDASEVLRSTKVNCADLITALAHIHLMEGLAVADLTRFKLGENTAYLVRQHKPYDNTDIVMVYGRRGRLLGAVRGNSRARAEAMQIAASFSAYED